ncbi:MAG TPA: ribosomal RNA small subunit methyltransferase A [Candidatus Borkfalkia faecigallinarum]|uniref:Ribosomal RNA small subunit methyltransferase A n=1 Tax=Candidatus Borkfalkia faecigallinarum TaxID=2838509 RepID=A0A9D2ARJ5_9FIRM|nr:ribosomal RNA small subunit methyltransferase A [Candidatus Borkfalkia faecigallinarum]
MENLREVLARHGFSFKKQFGQNFISDTNLLESIVSLAGVDQDATVLEIGCGAGTLTRALAAKAGRVIAYEIDKKLQPVLAETLAGVDNAEVVFRDFLRQDMAELESKLPPYTVVANLPYYITTPLVTKFLDEAHKAKALVVMVQDDVARRFCAREGTPDYGAITAAIARRASAEIVKSVPRRMFFPVPNVDSAVVRLTFAEGRIPVRDAATYRATVRAAFLSRRKTLENNLMQAFSLPREEARDILRRAGVPDKARGETLSPSALAALADLLYERASAAGKK